MADTHNRALEDEIVKVIYEHKRRYKITNMEVANKVGVSTIAVWDWLHFINWPLSLSRLKSFSKACGLNMKIVLTNRSGEEHIF